MPFSPTPIPHLMVFEPKIWEDDRGYFFESYNQRTFREAGIQAEFVQDNQAFSTRGVLRGLHYQVPPFAQAKLVRVVQGKVLDVVVDLRPDSGHFGQWFSIHLSERNQKQLFVPRGFAHGYVVLSDTAIFAYKCDNFYSKPHEGGIRYDDPTLKIDCQLPAKELLVSPKDEQQPFLGDHRIFR